MDVQHRIAGIVFQTVSNGPIPGLDSDPYLRFSVRGQKPDVRHTFWKVDADSDPRSPAGAFCPERTGALPAILGSSRVRRRLEQAARDQDPVKIGRRWAVIRDEELRSLEIYYLRDAGEDPLPGGRGTEYFVAANLGQIFSSFLPCFSATLLHSSGVIRKDRAAIFIAPDEGGKTTVAMLGRGSPVLSDDQVILREQNGELLAHATPLGGMTDGPGQARVGGLFVLKKADAFGLAAVSPRQLLQRLWVEHRNYTFLLPRGLKKRAFELSSDICRRTPVREMAFPKEFVDWVEIEKVMGRG